MVFWIVRDSVGAGLLAIAILNTPMGPMVVRVQQAGFDGVLEIAIASKPAPTGDGGLDYAGAVATMSSIEAPASALRR
jgi:hypothetical protein